MSEYADLWIDEGPISQGKILTAVMQAREGEARKMMQGWTAADLRYLSMSAEKLARLAKVAATWKEGPR